MKRLSPFLLAAVLLSSACSKHEPSKADLAQAASYVSEAEFAITIKEFPRAEDLLVKATALVPGSAEYWMELGTLRVTTGKKSDGRKAYEEALSVYKDLYKKTPGDGSVLLQQVYVLSLLGRVDDARAVLQKGVEKHPDNAQLKGFLTSKTLDRMLADPAFKALAI